jgi:acetolactate synthase I/III small subunit
MLCKVTARAGNRGEIAQICDIFDGKIVDVAPDAMMLEFTGPTAKLESALQLIRPYGLKEMVRTGVVAMVRGGATSSPNVQSAAAAD